MDTLRYIESKAVNPDYYDRRFDLDLPKKEDSSFQRVAAIALPFLSLHSGIGSILAVQMNGARLLSNSSELWNVQFFSYDGFVAIMKLTLTTLSVAGAFFSFKVGVMVTTLSDISQSSMSMICHLSGGEYKLALNELFQTIGSTLYLGTMYYGSLEVVLVSLLVKAIVCGLEGLDEYEKGRYPELVAKFAMGMIRLHGVHFQGKLIQRRDYLNSLDKYQTLLKKIAKSKDIDSLYNHPLVSLDSKIAEGKVEFTDDRGNTYDFGSFFSEYGGGLVKGMNLSAKTYEDRTELEFKVNHAYRDQITEGFKELKTLQKHGHEFRQVLDLNKTGIGKLDVGTIIKPNDKFGLKPYDTICTSEGVVVEIGHSERLLNSYDTVKITLPGTKSLYDVHKILSFAGLEDALSHSTAEDMERMKIGHLFHHLSPKASYEFERSSEFFELSNEALKRKIIKLDPAMEEKLTRYLPKTHLKDILPGKKRFYTEGLSKDLKATHNFGLTTLLVSPENKEETFYRLSSILNMGLISTEMKERIELSKQGLDTSRDHYGSHDSVFVQATTTQKDYDEFSYSKWLKGDNNIRLNFDPALLNTGTYQYHQDVCGHRLKNNPFPWFVNYIDPSSYYKNRDAIDTFFEKQYKNTTADNEIMIKDRIAPEAITGIVVKTERVKNDLLDYMRRNNHIKENKLFGRDIESFIQVGTKITS